MILTVFSVLLVLTLLTEVIVVVVVLVYTVDYSVTCVFFAMFLIGDISWADGPLILVDGPMISPAPPAEPAVVLAV